jgi:hypothetical protein
MQLLDFTTPSSDTSSDASTWRLIATLQEIGSQVEIQNNFSICHPSYKSLRLPSNLVTRLQQLPLNLQHRFLSSQLCTFLYGIYYNGFLRTVLALDADPVETTVQDLENNTYLGVDLSFYDRLHEHNSGKGFFDPGWQILYEEKDGSLAVRKGELTLHIDRIRHLGKPERYASVGALVAVKIPPNLVQNGFYMAVGNAGRDLHMPFDQDRLVRVYFNLNAEGAVAVMGSLTQQLNGSDIPFSFKALYNPSDYGRFDSAVLYFRKSRYALVRTILQSVYTEHQCQFGVDVPLFTKQLAPGLALAEEPDRKFAAQESFGLNRCQIVANGLLDAWKQGNETKENPITSIFRNFADQGIDVFHPYLNPGSNDIYVTLDHYC